MNNQRLLMCLPFSCGVAGICSHTGGANKAWLCTVSLSVQPSGDRPPSLQAFALLPDQKLHELLPEWELLARPLLKQARCPSHSPQLTPWVPLLAARLLPCWLFEPALLALQPCPVGSATLP